MSSLLCCKVSRNLSPELPNARLVSSGGVKPQSLLHNSHIPHKIGTDNSVQSEDTHELQRIFASSQDQSEQTPPRKRHNYASETVKTKVRSRGSTSHLRDVLREKLSRDSIFSIKGKKKFRAMLGEEEIERRKELKRALHQRLRDELLADRSASQGGYDVDAKIIVTPTITKSRSGGNLQMSPMELRGLMRRLESSQSESKLRNFYQVSKSALDTHTKLSSNHENANASKVTSVWEDDVPDSEVPPQYAIDEIKQIFKTPRKASVEIVDMDRKSYNDSPAAHLLRSDTVVHASNAGALLTKHHRTASYASVPEEPVSPDLLPLRMPSITESVQKDWQLPMASSRHGAVPTRFCAGMGRPTSTHSYKPIRLLSPKGWTQDSVGIFDISARSGVVENDSVDKKGSIVVHTSRCDPTSEESNFGGVDGEAGYDVSNRNANVQEKHTEEEARADTLEGHKVKLAQLSPSKVLATAMSLPQLPNMARRNRNQSSSTYSMTYSQKEHGLRYSSSSSYIIPDYKQAGNRDTTSSVYTYPGGSIMSTSPQSSLTRLGNLSDRLKSLRVPDYGVLPYYYRNGSADISTTSLAREVHERNAARRRTIDTTSFQSSTDSFRAQELAAAATRIVPKPRLLSKAKMSKFKEELEDETIKSKSPGGKGMLGVSLSNRSSSRSYDGSEEWYSTGRRQGYGFAFVPEEGESAASVWERALKDHAEEIASTPPKRPGSISHAFGSLGMKNRASHSQLKKRASRQPSRVDLTEAAKYTDIRPLIVVTPVKLRSGRQKVPTTTSSWTKYPSHTRAERSESPAGEADHVFSRDFASEQSNDSPKSTKSRKSVFGRRKKSRSMTFSRQMFKSWSRLYKSQSSSNVKGQARGIRSSISNSGFQAYQKREMRALEAPTPQPAAEREVAKVLFPMAEANESTVTTEGDDVYANERSAKAWSKLYEDCVKHPQDTDTEAGSVLNASASYLHPSSASKRTTPRSLREPSASSRVEMRESTVEFQRELRVREVEAQREALEAAENISAE